jgi:hypothetical protein
MARNRDGRGRGRGSSIGPMVDKAQGKHYSLQSTVDTEHRNVSGYTYNDKWGPRTIYCVVLHGWSLGVHLGSLGHCLT